MKYWLKNLFPRTIKQYHSKHNGLIRVVLAFNQPRLIMGGLLQSGMLMRKVWSKAISEVKEKGQKVEQALIIGLGCGDVAGEIQKYYPKAKMAGVEIDDQVIEAAQCYFNLATIKNLKIAIDDGVKYVEKLAQQKQLKKFDLIIIDALIGDQMPKGFKTKKFYQALTKLLTHNGVVIYNHLFFKKHKERVESFIKEMEKVFGEITLMRTRSNLLIFGWF
ncbi:MAG: fused MFS/spermidine synthase [Patescibacteria group bacterium]|nr:fused MFS/spermidine synthase [Patescibacteria group bacterium]